MPADDAGQSFVTTYMDGFTAFIAASLFMFLLGSLFGKVMEDSGAAPHCRFNCWLARYAQCHRRQVLACAILIYGGVSLFVVAFWARRLLKRPTDSAATRNLWVSFIGTILAQA